MNNTANQPIKYTGNLDVDSDHRDIKVGDYFYALNFRNIFTENGREGSGENISGNVLIPNTLPSGDNKCIGKYEDVPNQTVFYFIWNSLGTHTIYRYYSNNTTDLIQKIVQGEVLNFSEWDYITHVNLVGDLLYWTDGVNPQRKIDVKRANTTNKLYDFKICFGAPDGTAQEVQYAFNLLTIDITFPNTLTSRYDVAAYAYTQFNTYSSLLASFDIVNNGEYLNFTAKSAIDWVISVTPIGTLNSWYKPNNWYPTITERVLDVVGWPAWLEPDTSLINVPTITTNYLQGSVFQFAYSINYDSGEKSTLSKYSRLMYNDNIDRDNGSTLIYPQDYTTYNQNLIQSVDNLNAIRLSYTDSGRFASGRDIIKSIDIYVRNRNTEVFRLVDTLLDYELEGFYVFLNSQQGYPVSDNYQTKLYDAIPITSKCQEIVNNKMFYINNKVGYDNVPISASVYRSSVKPVQSWDTSNVQLPLSYGRYQFGLVYYDRFGRNNFVQTDSSLILEASDHVSVLTQDRYYEWTIKNTSQPPIWATHYAWVRTRELTTAAYYPADLDGAVVYTNTNGTVYTWGSPNITRAKFKVKYPLSSMTYKQYEAGDQFLMRSSGDPLSVQIISYDASTNEIVLDYNVSQTSALIEITSLTPIRIYTPYKSNENELFYEVYESYNVLDPHTEDRRHSGGFQGIDQILGSQDATGYFYYSWDTFLFKNPNYPSSAWQFVDSPFPITSKSSIETVTTTRTVTRTIKGSDYGLGIVADVLGVRGSSRTVTNEVPVTEQVQVEIPINVYPVSSIGRPNAQVLDNKQVILDVGISFSDAYTLGTAINGLGSYNLLSNGSISVGFGAVNKAQNIDNILLLVCDNKSFSVYIDKGILQGQDGSQTISVSSQVIGAYRELNGLHGTINPESFATNDGLVFWWDAYRGEVCQYSNQGIDVISSKRDPSGNVIIGMNNYFSPKGRLGIKSNRQQYKVMGVIHKQFKEYILCFPEITVGGDTYAPETIAYNYIGNGWKTQYSYLPENACSIGQNIVTFANGALYLHSPSATKNTFYSGEYPTMVGSCINIAPNSSKSYLSISVESNKTPNFPTITTPITDWNLSGQLSELLETDFELMNGSYFAAFLRNKLTPNFDTQAEALIEGEALQSQTMDLMLSKDSTSLFWINGATVYLIKDDLTN